MYEAQPWPDVPLDNLKASKRYALNGGPFGSKLVSRDYESSGVPVIRGTNLSRDTIFSYDDFVFVSDRKADELLPNNAHPGDLIFTQRGTLGQVGLIPKDSKYSRFVISQSQMKLTVDATKADPYFLYCFFRAPLTVRKIHDLAISSGVPHINLDTIRRFTVPLPPLPIQRRIAAILAAYDDLIANNARRIAILEDLARSLYREWFVEFRFPGHEHIPMVESELGLVPEGWAVKRVADVAVINASSIKAGSEPERIDYIDISSVSPGRVDKVESFAFTSAPGRARRKVTHGDTIWSTVRPNRRSYALILDPPPTLVVSTGFAVITPKEVPYTYLYHAVTTEDFIGYLTSNATGSAYPAVNSEDFRKAVILVPSLPLLAAFHDVVAPLFDERQNLNRKNANLRQTRDLLLPKLISGALDVAHLDLATGAPTP